VKEATDWVWARLARCDVWLDKRATNDRRRGRAATAGKDHKRGHTIDQKYIYKSEIKYTI
jgi:hypothetical protein